MNLEDALRTPMNSRVQNRILILDTERVKPEYRIRSWDRKIQNRYLNYDECVTEARVTLACWSWYHEDEIHAAAEGTLLVCNRCGSTETIDTAKRYMASVMSYQMFRCASCTGYRRLSWEPTRMSIVRGV